MKVCPKCNTENIFEGAQFCKNCGASLTESLSEKPEPGPETQASQDDGMDFVVTEPGVPTTPQFLKTPTEDSIEIASNASLLNDRPLVNTEQDFSAPGVSDNNHLIGDSSPHIPIPEENTKEITQPQYVDAEPVQNGQVEQPKKLSQEEVANLRKQLYGSEPPQKTGKVTPPIFPNNVIDPKKLNELKVDPAPPSSAEPQNSIRPIEDPAAKPHVEMAPRSRGVAFFRGNFIQLISKQALHSGDEITVNNRAYVLKPKKIGHKAAFIAFAAALVIILTIIGTQFVGPTVSGEGEIIGVVLNEYGQPFMEGARVSIPSLKKSTTSNAQGFFRFHDIPTGTYEIEYVLGDSYWGTENVTVVEGQSTLSTCAKLQPILAEKKKVDESTGGKQGPASSSKTSGTDKSADNKTASANSSGKGSSSGSSSNYGKISLVANVPEARLTVDGNIQGSGNNTYSRINAGTHTVTVSKPGYKEYSQKVTVEAGKTLTLNVDLARLQESPGQSLGAEDHYELGKDALAKGNFEAAITDLTASINKNPGYAPAYIKRAEAYTNSGRSVLAIEDYIRAGEISRLAKQTKQAKDAFNAALKLDKNNPVAWVGLAGVRYDENDFRPALTDYETALDKDKTFYPALFGAGISAFRLGDYKKADKYFKRAYKENGNDPYLYQYMMLNSFAKDDFNKVRELYAQYKTIVGPAELAEFKASSRFAPILRIINEAER